MTGLRAKNAFLEERVRQLEEQAMGYEQRLFQTEKTQKSMIRDTMSVEQVCEQYKQETARANARREASDSQVLELRQRLCDVYIDMRSLQN